ncbi:hypothetical protein F5X96DRAFT_664351 [Biscogniauxia mediterranea]|nr:hypothetical protein F5X96DRAFT_664351 [Biscogniauxia mediterranea]
MSTHPQQPPKPLDLTTALLLASHPATSGGPAATAGGGSPTSPQHERDAARGVSGAEAWKPQTTVTSGGYVIKEGEEAIVTAAGKNHRRRPSYSQEDHKHELQMSGLGIGIGVVGSGGEGGGVSYGKGMTTGFSET